MRGIHCDLDGEEDGDTVAATCPAPPTATFAGLQEPSPHLQSIFYQGGKTSGRWRSKAVAQSRYLFPVMIPDRRSSLVQVN